MAKAQKVYPSLPILIVDDDEQSLLALAGTLRTAGITNLRTVSDSTVVPALLQHEAFSLVLLDLNMPGLTGYEILKWAVRLKDRPPFIIVTGGSRPPDFALRFTAGVIDYLVKPVDRDRLVSAVKAAVDAPRKAGGGQPCSGT